MDLEPLGEPLLIWIIHTLQILTAITEVLILVPYLVNQEQLVLQMINLLQ